MTINGTETFEQVSYKVGSSICHSYAEALIVAVMESQMTSSGSYIEAIREFEY